ncbi:hypothetical protein [Streptomyces sp. NBC_01518]|uniref:hypothetical protein n=1 Tax=Streptomyces sp. NBC_01518 TaxID=2903891 RepID=UPI00386C58AE
MDTIPNGPGIGSVTLADQGRRGTAPRGDVAAVITALLTAGIWHRTLEPVCGDTAHRPGRTGSPVL